MLHEVKRERNIKTTHFLSKRLSVEKGKGERVPERCRQRGRWAGAGEANGVIADGDERRGHLYRCELGAEKGAVAEERQPGRQNERREGRAAEGVVSNECDVLRQSERREPIGVVEGGVPDGLQSCVGRKRQGREGRAIKGLMGDARHALGHRERRELRVEEGHRADADDGDGQDERSQASVVKGAIAHVAQSGREHEGCEARARKRVVVDARQVRRGR